MTKKGIKKALVMTLTDASSDPRPLRYLQYLNMNSIETDLLSYPLDKSTDVKIQHHFELPPLQRTIWGKIKRRLKNFIPIFYRFFRNDKVREYLINLQHDLQITQRILNNHSYDLMIVQDLYVLPIAIRMRRNSKILFDAREFYPAQNEEKLWFRLFIQPIRFWICEKYLYQCDHITTVSDGLKTLYEDAFNVDVSVFRSIPGYCKLAPGEVNNDCIKIVYHGLANRNRQIEKMIEIVRKLPPNFTLDLYLKAFDLAYLNQLKDLAKVDSRVSIHKPIPYKQIIPVISSYDIGINYTEPTTLNHKHGLPNKFFEYIQARLMLAVGPALEKSSIVYEYECGVVSEEFTVDSMVNALKNLKASDIYAIKLKTNEAAKILNFENEQILLNNLFSKWAKEDG